MAKQLKAGACPDRQCLFPTPCKNLVAEHTDYVALLRKLRALPGVKKVFIRSGIRFDYLLADPELSLQSILVLNKIMGRKKVAVYVGLVAVLATLAGWLFGLIVAA